MALREFHIMAVGKCFEAPADLFRLPLFSKLGRMFVGKLGILHPVLSNLADHLLGAEVYIVA